MFFFSYGKIVSQLVETKHMCNLTHSRIQQYMQRNMAHAFNVITPSVSLSMVWFYLAHLHLAYANPG